MQTTALKYQSSIMLGGGWFSCVESYDSILERLRDTALKFSGDDQSMRASFFEMVELTIATAPAAGEEARPTKVAVAPQAIVAVLDVPPDQRDDVVG